ncbi:MAG: FG-GAP repeat domain-containing protein, partial [Candidatus Binatia bacterium]
REPPSRHAFRRRRPARIVGALFAAAVVAALAFLAFLASSDGPESQSDPARDAAGPPAVRFVDVTRDVGIDFVHRNGAYGEKLLPETMGGGVAFVDFDADGDPDLLFIGGSDWSWREARDPRPSLALYRNDHGRFTDVTRGSGLDVQIYGMGVAAGDYDADGGVDLFITAVGGNRLFRNLRDGRFEDVTERSGVAGEPDGWSTSAAWVDVDRDGDLDLFVANYVRWSRAIDLAIDYRLPGIGRAYGPPLHFTGTFPYLYRNDGGGRFVEVAAESGLQVRNPATGAPLAKSLGVAPVDVDDDGWIDLVVANDTVQNFVFRNRGEGRFEEVGAIAGVAFDSYGQTRGAMGIDVARFRNDDALGIAIGNFANEMNALYVSNRDELHFADRAIAEGVGQASQPLLKFGLFFFDYDLDGRLDLL